jgi:hypothetical protein
MDDEIARLEIARLLCLDLDRLSTGGRALVDAMVCAPFSADEGQGKTSEIFAWRDDGA